MGLLQGGDTMTNDNIITQEMWDSLNEELWDRRTEMTQMKIVIATLRRERDEARREVCNWSVGVGLKATSQAVAEERGWDCYEKETL
jgi:hypothetical protein